MSTDRALVMELVRAIPEALLKIARPTIATTGLVSIVAGPRVIAQRVTDAVMARVPIRSAMVRPVAMLASVCQATAWMVIAARVPATAPVRRATGLRQVKLMACAVRSPPALIPTMSAVQQPAMPAIRQPFRALLVTRAPVVTRARAPVHRLPVHRRFATLHAHPTSMEICTRTVRL